MKRELIKKRFYILQSKKEILRRNKINKNNKRTKKRKKRNSQLRNFKRGPNKKYILPNDFRIFENYEEVAQFFEEIFQYLLIEMSKKSEFNKIIISFDASKIINAKSSAIIYLLALVNSLKNSSSKSIQFKGNLPINSECRKLFVDSGFLDYCDYSSFEKLEDNNILKIKYGKGKYKPQIFKPIYEMMSKDKRKLNSLSPILIEIIDNSVQHAYSLKNVFKGKEWYFVCEETEEAFEFIVLDTGVGISKTMKKNFFDVLNSLPYINKNDESKIIESGLKGAFRTRTKEKNRGNGLPKIYKSCTKGNLQEMEIISGKAHCKIIKSNGNIIAKDHINHFRGTMYRWKIDKEDLK